MDGLRRSVEEMQRAMAALAPLLTHALPEMFAAVHAEGVRRAAWIADWKAFRRDREARRARARDERERWYCRECGWRRPEHSPDCRFVAWPAQQVRVRNYLGRMVPEEAGCLREVEYRLVIEHRAPRFQLYDVADVIPDAPDAESHRWIDALRAKIESGDAERLGVAPEGHPDVPLTPRGAGASDHHAAPRPPGEHAGIGEGRGPPVSVGTRRLPERDVQDR
jgi:hypothetical protein